MRNEDSLNSRGLFDGGKHEDGVVEPVVGLGEVPLAQVRRAGPGLELEAHFAHEAHER